MDKAEDLSGLHSLLPKAFSDSCLWNLRFLLITSRFALIPLLDIGIARLGGCALGFGLSYGFLLAVMNESELFRRHLSRD